MRLCGLVCFLLMLITSANTYCPPGFIYNTTGNSTGDDANCVCSKNMNGIVDCDQESGVARLAIGFCMSFDFDTNSTIIGKCPYNNNYTITELGTVSLYVTLPDNVSELEQFMCGEYHRRGFLCSCCDDHLESSMVSYSLDCIPCDHHETYYQLGRFALVVMRIVPVTVLYIVIILFDIRFMESPWSVFILYSQIIVNMLTFDRHLYSGLLYATDDNTFTAFVVKLVLAFYGVLNLNFIPNIIPPFCLNNLKWGRNELVIEYVAAIYPLMIIAAMYLCVHLHSRDFKLIVWPWKAIKYCLNFKLCCGMKRIVQRVTSQTIANSFSSFLILAFSKILFVSPYLIISVHTYDLNGTTINTTWFYNERPYSFFSHTNIPYFVFTITMLALFVLLPTLLTILYPIASRWCNRTPLSVKLFVESFYGWYKDGTEQGIRDFRALAGLHALLRIVIALSICLHIAFVNPLSPLANNQWVIPGVLFVACSMFFTLARPYKVLYMNQVESLFYALLGAISLLVTSHIGSYFAFILGTTPMLVFIGYTTYKAYNKLKSCYHQWN
ncbi:uncharacterized protein LOC135346097 [Halichondria panicea]|uniref:uncharacterized protein LOC135346097 n=1 Tax=Halichondria panicea TaxID=6063 RepID=UPI00312B3D17